jgi:ABC-2 type transport system ATP-binding protein
MTQSLAHVADDQPEILLAQDLQKSYGSRMALKGLSFSLRAGRVVGFLGPNGAGKTTSIRILTTILAPSSGHFVVDGIGSDRPEEIRRRIGVLPEGLGFPKQLTGVGYLTYFGELYGRRTEQARRVALSLLQDVGLQNRATSAIGSYSHGMRQRLGIARALVHDPAVVFLDEPTLGLDPRGQQELLRLIKDIARERNTGVVLCSHLLSEIEDVCDDVVIMNAGQVVAKGPVADVIGQAYAGGQTTIRIRVPSSWVAPAQSLVDALPSAQPTAGPGEDASGWLDVDAKAGLNAVLESLVRGGVPILGVESAGGRLRDVFLELTAEDIS